MKLAFVTDSCNNVTGIGRIICALADKFTARGHDVHVIAHSVSAGARGWSSQLIKPHTPLNSVNRWYARYAVPRILDGMECDVVNAFTIGRGANVVSAQSCHAAGLALSDKYDRQIKPKHNYGIVDRLTVQDERALFLSPRTKKIIAVSQLVKSQISEHYGVDPTRICVVPNGVDLHIFAKVGDDGRREGLRGQLGISNADFVMLFVGNEFARKGLHVVIKAMARFSQFRLRLVVVGGDEPGPFQSLACELRVDGNVFFVGRNTNPEDYFAMADAFVFPTFYEPFGIVIVEAMAAGIPVITSADAGAVEGATSGVQAMLLQDPHSTEELTSKLKVLIEDKDLRLKMVEDARSYASHFSWDTIADKTLDVYNEIL